MQRRMLLLIAALLLLSLPVSAQTVSDAMGERPVYLLIVDDFGNSQAAQDFTSAIQNADASLLPTQEVENGNVQTYQDLRNYSNFNTYETQLQTDLAAALPSNPSTQNCAVTPDQSAFLSTYGTAFLSTYGTAFLSTYGTGEWLSSGIPHGERVYATAMDVLAPQATTQTITPVKVDTNSFDTATVQQNIDTAISDIEAVDPNAVIIVNMSFSIVPCDYVTQAVAYNQLFNTMASNDQNSITHLQGVFTDVNSTFQSNMNPDPLGEEIETECENDEYEEDGGEEDGEEDGEDGDGDGDSDRDLTDIGCAWNYDASSGTGSIASSPIVIFVAAAGNGPSKYDGTRNDYPFAPALWSNVVSVSASDNDSHLSSGGYLPATYANFGTIMMPGKNSYVYDGTTYEDNGTSFAAPRYSAMLALAFAEMQNGFSDSDPNCSIEPLTLLNNMPQTDDWLMNPPTTYDVGQC